MRTAAWPALLQLSECLVGVGDSFGVDVASGSPVGDLLPVGPGEYPLDREHLGGLQSCLDARAEGTSAAAAMSVTETWSKPCARNSARPTRTAPTP
jgi:hypothetical protein